MKKSSPPKKDEKWVNLVTGAEFQWSGGQWLPTGNFPYGKNPMKILKEPASEGDGDR